MILIAVVAAALVLATVSPTPVGSAARRAVCTILQLVGADCGPGQDPVDDLSLQPDQCRIREESESSGTEYRIGWLKVGNNFGFNRVEFSNGAVELTAVDGASIAAAYENGTSPIDLGKLGDSAEAGAEIEVAAGLSFGYGSTWRFTDAAEEKLFRDEIDKYIVQQNRYQTPGGLSVVQGAWDHLTGNVADPRKPDITFTRGSLEANAEAGLGVTVAAGQADAKSGAARTELGLGATVGVNGAYEVMVENDANARTRSWTYQLSAGAEGSLNGVLIHPTGSATNTGALKVTRNENNDLVSLSFISTRKRSVGAGVGIDGGVEKGEDKEVTLGVTRDVDDSTVTATETTLALSTPEDQRIAQAWLSGSTEQLSSPFALSVNALVPSSSEKAGGGDFGQLLYEKATVSQSTYHDVSDATKFEAELNLGFALGASYAQAHGSSTATASSYLGAPGADGVRPMLDFAACY